MPKALNRLDAMRHRSFALLLLLALVLVLGWATRARAQEAPTPEDEELGTPRRTLSTLNGAVRRGDRELAARALNVPKNAGSARLDAAFEQAERLDYLLSRALDVDLDAVSDEPDGNKADGLDTERIGEIELHGKNVSILLSRSKSTPRRWVVSAGTLARVPELYQARGPSALEARMPKELRREALGLAHWQWIGLGVAIALALALAQFLVFIGYAVGSRLAARTRLVWDEELLRELRGPSRLLLSVLVFLPLAQLLALPEFYGDVFFRISASLGVVAISWIAIRVVGVVSNAVERRAIADAERSTHVPDNLRGVQTRVRVLRRVISVLLAICGGAVMLMQFEVVRSIGVSLLASAGLAGIVLGVAAQRTLGSVVAGIQLSFTQPIRIGDQVILEGEWGVIEEITLTYVVIKIWDERRMVVPVSRFFEQPFQNWTKVPTGLHGTVMMQTDYRLPVDELRKELARLVALDKRWDGRTNVVHITDFKDRTIEVRVLVSARSAGELFELRAFVREGLVKWLATLDDGRYLPRQRLDVGGKALHAVPSSPDDADADAATG
jgi:small-conductance mechanosensitive channel